jgi:hypothetical protein
MIEDNTLIGEDIYVLKVYPKHLRPIIKLLMKHENLLSDGFEWYADVKDMTKLAQDIYNLRLKEITSAKK